VPVKPAPLQMLAALFLCCPTSWGAVSSHGVGVGAGVGVAVGAGVGVGVRVGAGVGRGVGRGVGAGVGAGGGSGVGPGVGIGVGSGVGPGDGVAPGAGRLAAPLGVGGAALGTGEKSGDDPPGVAAATTESDEGAD